MSRQIPREKIVKTVLDSIYASFDLYQDIAGEWLDKAPEYFVTVNIFNDLAKMKGAKWVTLERNVQLVLSEARASAEDVCRPGRADIVLWRAKEEPRVVIEVKSPIYSLTQSCVLDIERLSSMLKSNSDESKLQFGLFAYYTATEKNEKKSAKQIIEKRKETITKRVQSLGLIHKSGETIERDDCAYYCGVVVINKP